MQNQLIKILGILAIIATLVCFLLAALGMIGAVNLGKGCFMRYDEDGKGGSDSITTTSTLNATANYKTIPKMLPDGTVQLIPDPNHFGEWLNTDLTVIDNQKVKLQINGEISLCLAYIPKNNLQFTESTRPGKSNLDDKDNMIPIPRISDRGTPPLSLILDAKNGQWRNITELYTNDRILVSISPNYKTGEAAAANDAFKGDLVTADCAEGKTTYSPICGRYSVYYGEYTNDCQWRDNYWKGNKRREKCPWYCFFGCIHPEDVPSIICSAAGDCCTSWICDNLGAWLNVYATMPEPYKDDGSFTVNWSDNPSNIYFDFPNLECSYNSKIPPRGCPDSAGNRDPKDLDFIRGKCPNGSIEAGAGCLCIDLTGSLCTPIGSTVPREEPTLSQYKRFWYTADGKDGAGPTGLIWRLNGSGALDSSIGTPLQFAKFAAGADQPIEYGDHYKVIYNIPFITNIPNSFLQYRVWSPAANDNSKNTGGYVLNIKQTKCYRENGNSFSDTFANRGKVEYIIVDSSENPNTSGKSYSPTGINVDSEGNATITMNKKGYLWIKILNSRNDYKDSEGSYKVKFKTSVMVGSFTIKVMNPLLELFRSKVQGAAETIFKNMVCYRAEDTSSCTNFFTYIKAILILYVMSYGAMYLLGMVKINQQELVMRLIKIAIISGLMNGKTFEFFNNYLFDTITYFSDTIIANMSGYSLFTSTNKISNPFMFLDAVMSKIFFSQTFIAQLLALLSLGLSGIIYFIIVFIAIGIVIITAFRAVAVYIMAFMATCILISIAPLFLTFLLFDFTRYLFDNWVRFTLRYMLEPVILMAGIIVLTQLFTIYLDFALGYSVCWKCALPIKIPFIGTILPLKFTNVPIFCINWFAPWGFDYMSGMMGVSMQHIIGLVIIAYGMYGYVEFSGDMVVKLTGAVGGPSATKMGGDMSNPAETAALKPIGMDNEAKKGQRGTRDTIKGAAKQRLKDRNKTLDKAEKARKKILP